MNRWAWFVICALLGLGMLACGLMVPAHLRAVDIRVIARAGEAAGPLANDGQDVTGPHAGRFASPESSGSNAPPFTEFIIRLANREQAMAVLEASPISGVKELLRFRDSTNTAIFPPAHSASGQALDAALSTCGLLMNEECLTPALSSSVALLAAQANRGGDPQPFEQVLVDLMSLGQRFNWDQLAGFVRNIEDPETLRLQANLARKAGGQLPVLFSAVTISRNPAGVARYLMNYSLTGLKDLDTSLRFGAGGVNELLRRNQRLHESGRRGTLLLDWCLRAPWFALGVKWFLYAAGGFLLAMSLHFARPAVSALERPLQVRGFHVAREVLFALGFLVVVLLVSEPFLAQDSQKAEFPLRLRLPTVGSVVPSGKPGAKPSLMNTELLLTMLLFFVLQALLYTACIVKLAEIRRQRVPTRTKLLLLENEEHLFDAGLYLGFVGTIISLILMSLGVFKQNSLMAAYSATSFGIIFVSIFKILHLRPARRKLLMEAEIESAQPGGPAQQSFATTS